MKICFVGPANSGHIVKWCKWFSQRNHEVHVISFTSGEISGAEVHQIRTKADAQGGNLGKIRYLFTGSQIKRLIDEINPDIINVHYATSYGAATALSGVKKYILSVWGSDIYDFPKKSILHRGLLKYSLKKAALLFSTSHAMAEEASQYTDKEFIITPFGVDMDLFSPSKRTRTNDEIYELDDATSFCICFICNATSTWYILAYRFFICNRSNNFLKENTSNY